MDPYEATKTVFSRIQNLDPENASKIMGLLLIQDHGEKDMVGLAFGPESLLQSVVLKARQELGISPNTPSTPSRQNSASSPSNPSGPFLPNSLNIPTLSVSSLDNINLPFSDELISPSSSSANYFPTTDVIGEVQLQEQLSFLNDPQQDLSSLSSPGGGATWGPSHRRSCSVNDISFGDNLAGSLGWKPCLYYARGYCKNGSSCRFMHGGDSESSSPTLVGSPNKIEMMEQCHELLRSKSMQHHKLTAASQLMSAAANSYPYSGSKFLSLLLQRQQNEYPRAAAALMMEEDMNKFSRSRLSRSNFLMYGDSNPGSRQIYLTFPADSTFQEEDVSNYFSIFGPVQDVRIPYQQKRMFGFVSFVYPETVRLILAEGNPHFVCDARVLVKPYKEKGKVPDKCSKQQQQLQMERGEFLACNSPAALDPRDPFDSQLGFRMMCNNSQEMQWRRKLEEQTELQQALELQSRRVMSLRLDVKRSNHHRALSTGAAPFSPPAYRSTYNQPHTVSTDCASLETAHENGSSNAAKAMPTTDNADSQFSEQAVNDSGGENRVSGVEIPLSNEESHLPESLDHNLPDSPFASPMKGNAVRLTPFTTDEHVGSSASSSMLASSFLPASSTLELSPFKSSAYFQLPRFSTGSGAIGM